MYLQANEHRKGQVLMVRKTVVVPDDRRVAAGIEKETMSDGVMRTLKTRINGATMTTIVIIIVTAAETEIEMIGTPNPPLLRLSEPHPRKTFSISR